ncbi:MAG TPA: hypothetical protein VJB18_00775 [Burkholderiales bacterium]|nr:hypothetical protein [Burkholderiales bacterium]
MAKLLYFAALADRLGRTAEDAVLLPATVTDVRTLLTWLRGCGEALSETAAVAAQGSIVYSGGMRPLPRGRCVRLGHSTPGMEEVEPRRE